MHRLHIRRQRHRKPQRLLRSRIPNIHRHNRNRRFQSPSPQHSVALHRKFSLHAFVVPPHMVHEDQQQRKQQHHDPRSLRKLRHHNHADRNSSSKRSQSINKHPASRGPALRIFPPVPHHPRLRQCESQKRSHRKQRNQPVRNPAK